MRLVSFFLLILLPISVITAQSATTDSTTVADSLSYQTDEVVVTGTRYGKKIIDIPYPVTRISNREFQYERKAGVDNVLSGVPGVFLQSRYGNHDVRISIRGFGSRSNSGIRGVRILLDGIPESEPDGQTRIEAIDFNSIGRIEIVKGNASSLYTNSPGGVINFINDVDFDQSFLVQFNDVGSFGLRRNGFKFGYRTPQYTYLLTYSYHNYDGYRKHSNDWWHILNTVLETRPTDRTRLQLLGYYVKGQIFLPGSLTKSDYKADPFQANQREVNRYSEKGRLGLRFDIALDANRKNELELTGYGTIKYFERVSSNFRVINRYGLGASGRFVHRNGWFNRKNELSFGFDLLNQTGPVEAYNNIGGRKGDNLSSLTDDTIANVGFFMQYHLNLIHNRLDLLVTSRYDKVVFDVRDQLLGARSAHRRFEKVTPKAALNYKLSPAIALYGSIGRSFESPAGNELDNPPTSSQSGIQLNPDLQPQKATNIEMGIKGSAFRHGSEFLRSVIFEASLFRYLIDDEIIPFEVFSSVFFRNAARTIRNGLELGVTFDVYNGWLGNLAYTYSDFKYDKYEAIIYPIRKTTTPNEVSQIVEDFSGNVVPNIPRHTLFLALSKSFVISPDYSAFIKGSMQAVSSMYVDDQNSEKTDTYQLFNLLSGFDLFPTKAYHMIWSFGVNNIFNKKYIGFININSTRKEFYEAGSPRTFFASLKLVLPL